MILWDMHKRNTNEIAKALGMKEQDVDRVIAAVLAARWEELKCR